MLKCFSEKESKRFIRFDLHRFISRGAIRHTMPCAQTFCFVCQVYLEVREQNRFK